MIYLSHNDSIRSLLNIQDQNIFFGDFLVEDKYIKECNAKVLHASLTYSPEYCQCCEAINNNSIIKHGFKTSLVKIPPICNFNAFLALKKQRFFCKNCNSTFSTNTPLVQKNCNISTATKSSVLFRLMKVISEKDIDEEFNVSHNTVNRIVKNFKGEHSPNRNYLPTTLCFDKFKSVKQCEGAMSFIYCNAEMRQIIDIVPDRRLNNLKKYFLTFSSKARNS